MVEKKALFDVWYQLQEFASGTLLVVHGYKRETVWLFWLEVESEFRGRGVSGDVRHYHWPLVGRGFNSFMVWAPVPCVLDVCARVKFGNAWKGDEDA